MPFNTVCFDEIHMLASPTSLRSKAAAKVKAQHVYGLTATPLLNSIMDLWMQVNIVRPGFLHSWYSFVQRYCFKNTYGSIVSYRHVDELAQRIAPLIITRTLAEVGMELPPVTETVVPVELNTFERKQYDLIKNSMLFELEPYIISKIENPVALQSAIVAMGKLFEVCDSMELLGEANDSSKIDVLKELVATILADGTSKLLIITRFSRFAKIIERELGEHHPLTITGETEHREKILDTFNADPSRRILIGTSTLEAGLNIQVANHLINADAAWNPARMTQRLGRLHRNGQTKPCFVFHLVATKTVETWLQKKLVAKQEMSDRLLPKTFNEIKDMLS